MAKGGLKFISKGLVIPGVPMRDLSHEEVEQYGGYDPLLSSGLYELVEVKPKKTSTKQSEVDNGNDNDGR